MRRALLAFTFALALVMATPAPAWADHGHRHRHGQHQGGDDGCSKQSCNRHRHDGDNAHLQDSPVTIWFCPQPHSCDGAGKGDGGQQPAPKTTASLLPPTPQKIIGFVTTIFQETANFVSTILKLAV